MGGNVGHSQWNIKKVGNNENCFTLFLLANPISLALFFPFHIDFYQYVQRIYSDRVGGKLVQYKVWVADKSLCLAW